MTFQINATASYLTDNNSLTPVTMKVMMETTFIVPLVSVSVMLVANTWIIISLIHYGVLHRKNRSSRSNSVEKLNHGIIFAAVVLCSFLCELRLSTTIISISVSEKSPTNLVLCKVVSHVSYNLFNFSFFASFLVFWLRQRVFYSNKMMAVTYGTVMGFLSKYSIIFVLLPGTVGCVVHTVMPLFGPDNSGCDQKPIFYNALQIFAVVALTLTCTVGQVLLVGLFVYPLRLRLRHAVLMTVSRRYRAQSRRSVQSVTTLSSSVSMSDGDRVVAPKREWTVERPKQRNTDISASRRAALYVQIKRIMIRSSVALVVSIISLALVTWLTQHTAHDPEFRSIGAAVSDFVLFFHIFYIICTFASFKEMLSSPFYHC